jgi:hypothetical protein
MSCFLSPRAPLTFFPHHQVTDRLWRTIIDIIRSGQVPGRTAALFALSNKDFDSLSLRQGSLNVISSLRSVSTSAISPSASANANGALSVGFTSFNDGPPSSGIGGPVVQEFRLWDSFSGRDLDCQADGGGAVQAAIKQVGVFVLIGSDPSPPVRDF